jgi:hypothetical protein
MKPDDLNPQAPVIYDPSCEILEPDEHEVEAGLIAALTEISETTFKHSGHATRSVHAKSHGLLQGEIEVLPGLPQTLAQGMFAQPGHWPVVMRLSTSPGDVLDDKVSTPRGLALKVVGVPGAAAARLPGSEQDVTQDFLMINGPAFSVAGAGKFLSTLKLLAKTTDKAPQLKKAFSALLRGAESMLESAGKQSTTLMSMGGHPVTHILGETFYSQVPLLCGPYMVKASIAPVSPALKALTGQALDIDGRPDGLRDAVCEFFATQDAEWELRLQLCTDLERMPLEDASVVWPEELSPFIPVARIRVPRQQAWSDARSKVVDDGMSFSPWHGLAAHRPLGSVMRVRKAAYVMSARFRSEHNARSTAEPTQLEPFPD